MRGFQAITVCGLPENFQWGCQAWYSKFSLNDRRLAGFFLLSFTSPIEVLCDSQRFCKPRVEKHWCNFSAVNRWGTSVPCSLTEKNVIISFAIVNWKNRRAAVEEWHKWILRQYVVDDTKHRIPSYRGLMISGGSLAPLKSVWVAQLHYQCWGFTIGLGFGLSHLISLAVEPSSVLYCKLEMIEKSQVFNMVNWNEVLLSLNCVHLFPMKINCWVLTFF